METNLGSIANFNRVFQLSKAPYFLWASGHDIRHNSFIARCVEILEQDTPPFGLQGVAADVRAASLACQNAAKAQNSCHFRSHPRNPGAPSSQPKYFPVPLSEVLQDANLSWQRVSSGHSSQVVTLSCRGRVSWRARQ